MLKRLYIDNYRCFVNFELRLGRRTLLLGDNGSGKSSLFDALGALQSLLVAEDEVREAFPPDTLALFAGSNQQRFALEVEGQGGSFTYELRVEHDPDEEDVRIAGESLVFEGRTLYRYQDTEVQLFTDEGKPGSSFAFNPRRSFLAALEPKKVNRLATWFKDFLQGILILRIDPKGIDPSTRRDSPFLAHDAANFASWYRFISDEEPAAVEAALAQLRTILPGFRHLKKPTFGRAKLLQAEFVFPGGDPYTIDFDHLSDGQRALIILYVVLHAAHGDASVLCFDEPDNFVALPEIQPWLVTFCDALDEHRSQGLIISHSREIIDFIGHEDAVRLVRPDGGHVRAESVPKPVGITLGETLARGIHE
ncbi:ATP-binding protein [Nannocystis sp. SCPEA4]|uniref:AAA family ATPase n=1 Tax=Nannocystis sp. SCPEA4 TaxID=2996787 RepID=UPI002271D6BC|nr:ATP-binding protein [Nannocystis sp. SCPEA4]MCY1055360.1 ATP-binding protein [Nannocystis sp. SCPEA4]